MRVPAVLILEPLSWMAGVAMAEVALRVAALPVPSIVKLAEVWVLVPFWM